MGCVYIFVLLMFYKFYHTNLSYPSLIFILCVCECLHVCLHTRMCIGACAHLLVHVEAID